MSSVNAGAGRELEFSRIPRNAAVDESPEKTRKAPGQTPFASSVARCSAYVTSTRWTGRIVALPSPTTLLLI